MKSRRLMRTVSFPDRVLFDHNKLGLIWIMLNTRCIEFNVVAQRLDITLSALSLKLHDKWYFKKRELTTIYAISGRDSIVKFLEDYVVACDDELHNACNIDENIDPLRLELYRERIAQLENLYRNQSGFERNNMIYELGRIIRRYQ